MSLDIYIISPTPIKKKSTGILVRDDGKTRELSKAEAEERYPDADIQEIEIETNEFWYGNITHNLNEMAEDCLSFDDYTLYDLLWRNVQSPFTEDRIYDYIAHLSYCLYILKDDPEHFKKFNPENGWGNYEQLVEFVRSFIHALIDMPEGCKIEYSI